MLLHRPEDRRQAKDTIRLALASLHPDDQVVVLEDLLDELLRPAETSTVRPDRTHSVVPGTASSPAQHEPAAAGKPKWAQMIEDYCRSHPEAASQDGFFDFGKVAQAIMPSEWRDGKKRQWVRVTVLRKSPQSDRKKPRHPTFEVEDDGFRFYRENSNTPRVSDAHSVVAKRQSGVEQPERLGGSGSAQGSATARIVEILTHNPGADFGSLAKDVYGEASKKNRQRLRGLISNLHKSGRIRPIRDAGGGRWEVVPDRQS